MEPIKQIDIHQTKEKIDAEKIHIMDIRDPASFAMGHIQKAIHVSDANIKEFVETTDKETPLIVYCYHGNSSQGTAAYLQEQGFEEVYSMEGGFEHWRQFYSFEQG